MTTPRQAKQRTSNGPRTYAWPPLPPHEFEVISVTSAKDALPKPWLVPWAAKMTAECAVDKEAAWKALQAADGDKAAIDYLKGARFRSSADKIERGTVVHSALEAFLAGKELTNEDVEAQLVERRVPRELWHSTAAMVAGLMEFLVDHEPEVYWSEQTVYSRQHGYAGTPDLLCAINVGGTRVPAVVDVKTSPKIYTDTALQLVGYARADFVGLDDGTEAELLPGGAPLEYGIVVRPTSRGKYEKAVFTLPDELFECFLGCLTVTRLQGVVDTVKRPG